MSEEVMIIVESSVMALLSLKMKSVTHMIDFVTTIWMSMGMKSLTTG